MHSKLNIWNCHFQVLEDGVLHYKYQYTFTFGIVFVLLKFAKWCQTCQILRDNLRFIQQALSFSMLEPAKVSNITGMGWYGCHHIILLGTSTVCRYLILYHSGKTCLRFINHYWYLKPCNLPCALFLPVTMEMGIICKV